MTKLSIVIVAYGNDKALEKCLASIPKRKNIEVIVVDNNKENLGFARGCNVGAKKAQGEYLLFLNPDTNVYGEALDTLMKYLESHDDVGVVGPQLLDDDGEAYLSTTQQPTRNNAAVVYSVLNTLFPNNRYSFNYWYKKYDLDEIREVESISGAAMMLRKNDFDRLGGFDERFFMYWEDSDFCRRMLDEGKKIVFLTTAKITHAMEGSSQGMSYETRKWFRQSRYRFFKKYFGYFYAIGLESFLRIQEEWRLVLILLIAGFLRFYRLGELMPLIGDQARDFLAALEMLDKKEIPLLGIPSSVPRFKQGPVYIWMLAAAFGVFGIRPEVAGYMAALIGLLAVFGVYKLADRHWGRKVAWLSALILAASPMTVVHSRLAFVINPIPLFSVLYLLALQQKYRGLWSFFWVTLTFALLFQFELAVFPVAGLMIYYLWKHRKRIESGVKTLMAGLAGLLLGLFPQIIHDMTHGFEQLGVFGLWVGHRVAGFLGLVPGENTLLSKTSLVADQFVHYLTFYWAWNRPIFLLILVGLVIWGTTRYLKGWQQGENDVISFSLLWIWLITFGFFVHGGPSEAYFPVLFVPLALAVSWTIWQLKDMTGKIAAGLVLGLMVINAVSLVKNDYFMATERTLQNPQVIFYGAPVSTQLMVRDKMIEVASGGSINLKMLGPGSEFPAMLDNYRYLFKILNYPLEDGGVGVWILRGEAKEDDVRVEAIPYSILGERFAVEVRR